MTAFILAQIPNPYISTPVTTNQLALVWMNNNIVHWYAMCIVSLHIATPSVPNFDRTVFTRSDKPLGFAMERDTRHITGVAIKGEDCVWICAFDIVEFDSMVACGGEIALVRRDTEPVYL